MEHVPKPAESHERDEDRLLDAIAETMHDYLTSLGFDVDSESAAEAMHHHAEHVLRQVFYPHDHPIYLEHARALAERLAHERIRAEMAQPDAFAEEHGIDDEQHKTFTLSEGIRDEIAVRALNFNREALPMWTPDMKLDFPDISAARELLHDMCDERTGANPESTADDAFKEFVKAYLEGDAALLEVHQKPRG